MRETEIGRGGRAVRARDAGDPSGNVVMYFHGTPGSRLDLCFGEQLAADRGVRLVSFDRPGYGGSTPAPFGLASIAADAHGLPTGWAWPGSRRSACPAEGRGRLLLPQLRAVGSPGRGSPRAPGRSSWFRARSRISMTTTAPRCRCCRVIRPLRQPRSLPGSGRWQSCRACPAAPGWCPPSRICCPPATASCCTISDSPRRLLTRYARPCAREPVAVAGTTSPGSENGTLT